MMSVMLKFEAQNNTVVLTLANPAYLLFLQNWACYAEPLIGRRFLVYTNDYEFGRRISERNGYHVLVQNSAEIDQNLKENLDFGTIQYQRLLLSRTQLVAEFLEIGKSVLIADNDAVWLSDPFPYLEGDYGAHVVSPKDGTNESVEDEIICGGFLYLKQSPTTNRVWREVTKRHEALVARAMENHELAYFEESEQIVLNEIFRMERNMGEPGGEIEPLRGHFLDQLHFPHGIIYFDLGWPQANNVEPVVIHNNWMVGYEAKLDRFRSYGLWRVAAEDMAELLDADGGHRCARCY
ncbi:unnamed protein product [Calypogeia fissa]